MPNSRRPVGIVLSFCGTLQAVLQRGVLQHIWARYTSLNSIRMQQSLQAVIHLETCPSCCALLKLIIARFIWCHGETLGPSVCTLSEFSLSWRLTNLYESAPQGQPIQVLDEARDAVQTLHVGPTFIVSGSIDGHVRTYDVRMGELRSDFIGRACIMYR